MESLRKLCMKIMSTMDENQYENFRKISTYNFHIEHIWKKASIIELIKSIFNLSFFKLKFKIKYIHDFYKSLKN